jgi:hypothetical protein
MSTHCRPYTAATAICAPIVSAASLGRAAARDRLRLSTLPPYSDTDFRRGARRPPHMKTPAVHAMIRHRREAKMVQSFGTVAAGQNTYFSETGTMVRL